MNILVIDEVQFASARQLDQLEVAVDDELLTCRLWLSADFLLNVFRVRRDCSPSRTGRTNFRSPLPCWCGAKGRCNARIVNGVVAREETIRHRRRRSRRRALSSALPQA